MPERAVPRPTLHQLLVLTPARDTEERPLLESKSPLMSAAERTEARVACPYSESPSRFEHEKPMNQPALEQVRKHFGAFLALFGDLRRRHAALVGRDRLGPEDWHRICLYGETLPRLLLLRAFERQGDERDLRRYFEHRLPVDVGIVFKTVRGLLRLTRVLLSDAPRALTVLPPARRTALGFDAVPRHKPKRAAKGSDGRAIWDATKARAAVRTAPWTAEDLLLITERLDLMVGEEEVCAAPQGMLEATFALLVEGRGARETTELDPELASALQDLEALGRFADGLEAVYAELERFRADSMARSARTQAELRRLPRGTPHARAAAIFDAHLDGYLVEEHRFLERLAALQPAVLGAAGAAVVDPPLDLGLVDDLVPGSLRSVAEKQRGLRIVHAPGRVRIANRTGASREISV